MAGGKELPIGKSLRDTKAERSATILILAFFFLIGGIVLIVYEPSWYGVGDWLREYWYVVLIAVGSVVLMYRAYQGVSLFPRLERLRVGGGGSNGGGGSGGSGGGWRTFFMIVIYLALIILVLWIILQILEALSVWENTVNSVSEWSYWPWNWW